MLRRLLLTTVVALLCLGLLTLENKCSYFLGTQDLTAVITQVNPEQAPGKPTTWHVQLQDVAGNVITPTQDDIDALTDRLKGGGRGLKAIPVVGDIEWSTTRPEITLTIAAGVRDEDLHARLQSVGYTRPNPAKALFHLTEGIDLRGGVEFVCRLHKDDGTVVPANDEVMHTLRNRLDERGLTEPQVTRLANGDVEVVIPGGTPADAARTRKVLETTGRLEFRHVIIPFRHPTYDQYGIPGLLLTNEPGQVPMVVKNAHGQWDLNQSNPELKGRNRTEEVFPDASKPGEAADKAFYLCGKAELVGADVSTAYETLQEGQPAVGIDFTAIGAAKNDTFTHQAMEENNEKTGSGCIAIIFDGKIRSAPHVEGASSTSCVIHGVFTPDQIESLRSALRGGSLSVTPVVLSERVVGATLGEQTVNRSVLAMSVSYLLIIAFMWLYYHRLGTVANLCLIATTFFIWCTLSIFNATVTLPGLAGLVLSIGMAVDTNILVFERIREELAEEKGIKAAIAAGYGRAFWTIVDAHLTTFFTAFILYWIGTGPVKGFGLTLMIGIVVNLFSGLYIGRLCTDWLCRHKPTLSMARWVPVLRLPYVEWRWYGYVFSIVTSVAGVAWFAFGHLASHDSFERNFDIDFTGGNAAQVVFHDAMTVPEVRGTIVKAFDADKQGLNLLAPSELRIQPYFAALGGDHSRSREWVFRARDQQGGILEQQREGLQVTRAALQQKIIDLREASNNQQNPEAKKLEANDLKALDKQISDLTEQISERTEAFKGQLEKAFGSKVGRDGDEILAASADKAALTLRLAVLDNVDADQVAAIHQQLASNPAYAKVDVSASEPHALDVRVTLHGMPEARSDVDTAHDPILGKLDELIYQKAAAAPDPAQGGVLTAAEALYSDTVNAAGARRVTVAKPFPSSEHFSGQVAGQMQFRALVAIVLSLLVILLYVAARFEFAFGMGAVISLLHDVTITVGLISLMGIRIDLTVIAAMLTIIGYSINDRIVTFDRIRENLRKMTAPLPEIIDLSIAQTMPRTVLTTSTVVLTALVLLIYGGDALYAFNATLLIGLISGTYSSVFVASPLLLAFKAPLGPDAGSANPEGSGENGVAAPSPAHA